MNAATETDLVERRKREDASEEEDIREWLEYAKELIPRAESKGWAMKTLKTGNATHYPRGGDSVRVHYTGRLTDGTMFDSSKRRSQPLHFMVGRQRVIRGFDQAIQEMSVGQEVFLVVRSDFAYGLRGYPPTIPADAMLLFKLHLLSYVSAEETSEMEFEKVLVKGDEGLVKHEA